MPDRGIFYDDEAGCYVKWGIHDQEGAQLEILGELPLNQLKIRFRGKSRDYSKIFYDSVLVFTLNDQIIPQQVFAPPENCRRYGIKINQAQLLSNGNFVEVKFQLKGGYEATVVKPAAVTQAVRDENGIVTRGSALKVWPNFKRPGWKDYFVYFASSDGSVRTQWLRVIGEEPGEEVHFGGITPRGEFSFPPEYLEICANVIKDRTSREYWASFAVSLTGLTARQPTQSERVRLAVDFGTSNTCFCYSMPGEDPQPLTLSDKTCTLVEGLQLEDDLEHTWLPEFREQTLIPSELIFPREPYEVLSSANELRPIMHYTIPPLKWRVEEQKRIATGFKWRHATEPRTIVDRYQELQKMYLGLALRLAVAEVVCRTDLLGSSSVHPHEMELVITYPLSMSQDEFQELLRSYEYVRDLIKTCTGITLREEKLIDESYAGEIGTLPTGVTQKICVDVGGGTTDISVVEEPKESAGAKTLIVDSVRYAGNDFLIALTSDANAGKISTKPLIELQRRIRAEKEKILRDLSTFGNAQRRRDDALEALERFLRGLTQYLARIVALRVSELGERAHEEKLVIYLLGNGWRFILLSTDRTDLNEAEIVKQEIERRLRQELDRLQNAGIIGVIPQFEIEHPTDPKTVVARGALKVPGRPDRYREKREPQTFLGSNVRVVFRGSEQIFDWNKAVPFDLNNQATGVFISGALADFEQPRVPDDARLTDLNRVDIGSYIHKDKRIIRSALNVYLERWHKRYLHPRGWF